MQSGLTRRSFLKAGCLAAGTAFWSGCGSLGQNSVQRRPNIVIIYADDLGYGDVSCYNPVRGRISTPNMDKIALEGMRFTDAHSSSGVCSPSRYALLTGRYHWRSRLQSGIVGLWDTPLIAEGRLTLGTLVKHKGYNTAAVGKWHLGLDWQILPEEKEYVQGVKRDNFSEKHRTAWKKIFSRSIKGGPTARGFDSYFGVNIPNWPPYCFIEGDHTVGIPDDILQSENIAKNMASMQGPALQDWNLHEVLPTLANRACKFITQAAQKPEPFLLYFSMTSPHTPLAVNEPWRGKSGLDSAYADFVLETDAVIGQVLQSLEKSGVAENTLVIVTSDNGCAHYADVPQLEAQNHFPSGPFRGYKGDVWEGGHRVPFIVRWPGVVAPGTICDGLVHQADLMATVADVASIHLPDNAGEDSFSLMPILKGHTDNVREHAIMSSQGGLIALRMGTWKLIVGRGGGGKWSRYSAEPTSPAVGQLYNLDKDIAEQNNLYDQEPERVEQMLTLLGKLVGKGRSTIGSDQPNDVDVNYLRFLRK